MQWCWLVLCQGLALAAALVVFRLLESLAAMRGLKGDATTMPLWTHRLLRGFCLLVFTGPLCFHLWSEASAWAVPLTAACLLYATSFVDLSELTLARRPLLRSLWIWRWFPKRYFQSTLVKTHDLDPTRSYVFGVHPHAILPFCGVGSMTTNMNDFAELFPGVQLRGLAASACFFVPLYRDVLLGVGVVDAARPTARRALTTGHSLFLVPGGASEALLADPSQDVLDLRRRLGFVRLAMQEGATLVPVFSFNEAATYSQLAASSGTVQWLKRRFQALFGLSLPLITNIVPRRVTVTTVVGPPVDTPHIQNPSTEQVVEVLDRYIAVLSELYEEHKDKYNETPGKSLIVR